MTDQATPVSTGSDAQPIADANPIHDIIENAETESSEPVPENPEQEKPETEPEQPWPKKAQNALGKEKAKAARLKFERDQERQARADLEQKLAQYQKPQQSIPPDGLPKETDYKTYAEYLEAINDWKIDQKFAKVHTEQKQIQKTTQEQQWTAERQSAIGAQASEFIKENPEALAIVQEYADVIDEYSPQLTQLFLEADNAPLAFYNLAKEGKLEALPQMSLAKAAMEIGRAQTQAITRSKTKAPTPLLASRGSVASTKSLDSMSGDELLKWIKAPD